MPSKKNDPLKAANNRERVVAHMMTPGVVQIPGDVSVAEAASLMERERMPCLLVKDTESSFGLMTPTDIVKKVVAKGLEPDNIEVRMIMTRSVQFIEYDRLIDEASTLMITSGSPILIVTKEEQPVGVLTARDLILSPKQCPAHIPAFVSTRDRGGAVIERRAVIVRLSHVGALLESPVLLLPDTAVILSFSLPGLTSPLTIQGTVVAQRDRTGSADPSLRSSNSTIEIQFVNLSPSDQSRIKAWVLQNVQKSGDLA